MGTGGDQGVAALQTIWIILTPRTKIEIIKYYFLAQKGVYYFRKDWDIFRLHKNFEILSG